MTTKECSICKETKDLSEFVKDKHAAIGVTASCKACRRSKYKEWYNANPDKILAKREAGKEYRKTYYKRPEQVLKYRNNHLKYRFGITHEEYMTMYNLQGGKCAICGGTEDSFRNDFLSVDHNHITGVIRALLCNKCNRGLGFFNDNIVKVKKALKYLELYDKAITANQPM